MNWTNRIKEHERKTWERQTIVVTDSGDVHGLIRKGVLLWTPEQYAQNLLHSFWRMVK